MNFLTSHKFISSTLLFIILLGIYFRISQIWVNDFVYYDEGMWLQQGRILKAFVAQKQPNFLEFLQFNSRISLPTGKALWQFVANIRAFFFQENAYFFVRVVSAFSGILTLGVLYLFSVKFLQSRIYALLSCALLAVLPSHIYYSKLGLQESLSTLLFLAGLYFYIYGRHFTLRMFLAGTLWAGVYFSSYRMIILPIAVLIVEMCLKDKFDFRRFVYSMLTFACWIFILGSLNDGTNIKTTFGWMFHQSHLADNTFQFTNILSYPYYLFHFHNAFFGLLFTLSYKFFQDKEWEKAYPLLLFCVFALVFSFSQEQGVRYMVFLLPLIALSATSVIQKFMKSAKIAKIVMVVVPIIFIHHLVFATTTSFHKSAYQESIEDIYNRAPRAKVLSTQAMIQSLYSPDPRQVLELRRGIPFLLSAYQNGFRFLIIDPQGYVSLTHSKHRFESPLDNYLGFAVKSIPPVKTYEHFSKEQLDWFVWEHNENFKSSLKFLKDAKEQNYHQLRVYDINHVIYAVQKVLGQNGT